MSTAGPWHYEGHYILTDSEPQEIVCERVSEANRGLIASAPGLQAKIEALSNALAGIVEWLECERTPTQELVFDARAALKAAGRIP